MAKYRCSICGYIYDEEKEGIPFSQLQECPVCHQSTEKFSQVQENSPLPVLDKEPELKLDYPKEFVRQDESCRYMKVFTPLWEPLCLCPAGMIFSFWAPS